MMILLNLISTDPHNPAPSTLSESEQNEIYSRFKSSEDHDWEYIFTPIQDENRKQKMIDLFKELDKENPDE